MKRFVRSVSWLLGASIISGFAWAHHSTAMYDFSKSVTLDAVVRSFQWGNPHNYIQLIATNDTGEQVEWAVEAGTPVTASRMGWSKDTHKPGDHLTLVVAPTKDGSPNGSLKTATLANGTTLKSVGADAGASSPFDSLPSLQRVPANQP
jgi:hypothetical protein